MRQIIYLLFNRYNILLQYSVFHHPIHIIHFKHINSIFHPKWKVKIFNLVFHRMICFYLYFINIFVHDRVNLFIKIHFTIFQIYNPVT